MRINEAIESARRFLLNQGIEPGHADEIAQIVRGYGPQFEVIAYVWLADALTPTSEEALKAQFGAEVATCIGLLRRDEPLTSWAELALADRRTTIVLSVVIAERLVLVRSGMRDGNSTLLARLADDHPSFRRAVYRPGLAVDLCDELDQRLAQVRRGQRVGELPLEPVTPAHPTPIA